MKSLLLLLALCITYSLSFTQNPWTVIHPSPTANSLNDAHFISSDEGWVVGLGGTILYTPDAGQYWELQHAIPDEFLFSVFFIDNQEGWVCGWNCLYHTSDGGDLWEMQSYPACTGTFNDIFFINQDTGWIVGSDRIVLKTTNGGETWTKIMNSIYSGDSFKQVEFYDHLHGVAVGNATSGSPHAGFAMVTNDGGLNWTETTPEGCRRLSDITYYSDMCVWVCGMDGGLYRSLDGGYTWFDEYYDTDYFNDIHFFNHDDGVLLEHDRIRFTFDGGDNWDSVAPINNYVGNYDSFMSWEEYKGVAVGSNGLIAQTIDGGSSWENLNHGIRLYFPQIGFFDHFNGYVIGFDSGTPDLITTNDGGYTWNYDTIVENGPFYKMHLFEQQCYLLNSDSLLIMKTHDAGQNWEMVSIPDPVTYYAGIFFVNENTGFLCGPEGSLKKTNNGGNSWTDLSLTEGQDLRTIFFVDELNGWMIDYDGKTILHTTDGGLLWTEIQLGSSIIYQPESIFFINANIGYVNTEDGLLYKSTDGGETWEVLHGFSTGSYSSIYFENENQGWYLSARLYQTNDGGLTWDPGQYFGSSARALYFLDGSKGWLSGSNGMVVSYDNTVGISEAKNTSDIAIVFPNPATDEITIKSKYELEGSAKLKVYNMAGELLSNTEIAAGTDSFKLNIQDFPVGTYLIAIGIDNRIQISKFVKH